MTKKRLVITLIALVIALIPAAAFAHDGETIERYGSFLGGFTHPVLGLDHLLAMLSVGIVSAQIGGRAIWTIPATFVGVMAVGAGLGLLNLSLPAVEIGIALSVLILGVTIAANQNLPVAVALIAVGLFAIFHGFAHGAEMPALARPFLYILGFLSGTAVIHVLGVFMGDIPKHYEQGSLAFRGLGVIIAVFGVLFLTGII